LLALAIAAGREREVVMEIKKAVITAAGRNQRTLPLQTLIDRDGTERSVLGILVGEALSAGVKEVAVVVAPGDEGPYADVAGHELHFIPQQEPLGYGHAVYCARDFCEDEPFLHLVGDHLYVSHADKSCARQLVEVAEGQDCAVSSVQATRENLLPYYGTIGGRRLAGYHDLYEVETVIEKPTPTEAELRLIVPGFRAGYYLCFFGMHVLTPAVFDILEQDVAGASSESKVSLSGALAELARREKYLALEEQARRYDVGVRYGLLIAQLALVLSGEDREDVLTRILELLAHRELSVSGR
jgi:UTP--glucose-1-phosphate uridylyltransferase